MMISLISAVAWFVLGLFLGIVITYAWIESVNARSMEDICKDLEAWENREHIKEQ